jgi:hypothetical protein
MTRKMTGLIAAGSLAIGIVLGGAGGIVARDNATPDMADHMQGMTSMMSMMGAGSRDGMGSMMGAESVDGMSSMMGADHMADMASMMSMMGAGSPMTPNASMAPDASMSPEDHRSHHASPSPAATR